jgi:NTE family protein
MLEIPALDALMLHRSISAEPSTALPPSGSLTRCGIMTARCVAVIDLQDRTLMRNSSEAFAPNIPRAGDTLSLALQGGGSFGAFTWGVLDRLLEAGKSFPAVSGASAGAVNAVLLADGLASGGPDCARAALSAFWERLGQRSAARPLGVMHRAATASLLRMSGSSPYQFNPLGLNPLRDLLTEAVDFDRLRAAAAPRLLVAATRVRDGGLRLFTRDEMTIDVVLASSCLPMLQQAVEIDGEAYWDGGYSANPPLRDLVLGGDAEDVLLVQIMPDEQDTLPRNVLDITRRLSEIAFAAPLQRELRALEDMREACRGPRLLQSENCRRLTRTRLHRIAATDSVPDLGSLDPLRTNAALLHKLRDHGRMAADDWLRK